MKHKNTLCYTRHIEWYLRIKQYYPWTVFSSWNRIPSFYCSILSLVIETITKKILHSSAVYILITKHNCVLELISFVKDFSTNRYRFFECVAWNVVNDTFQISYFKWYLKSNLANKIRFFNILSSFSYLGRSLTSVHPQLLKW